MPTSQSKKALRTYRRDNGLCIHCGAQADRGTRCTGCAERDAENRRRYIARDKAAGVCITLGCSNKSRGGRVYCAVCTSKHKQAHADRQNSTRCMKCPNERVLPSCYCTACKAKAVVRMKQFAAKRIAEGRCRRCGDHLLGSTSAQQCETCLDKAQKYHRARKLDVMNAYGGPVCVGCGEDEILILQIDHINGGGTQHAIQIGGRAKLYQWLISNGFPPGYRVLCPNCNMRAARGLPFPNERVQPGGVKPTCSEKLPSEA